MASVDIFVNGDPAIMENALRSVAMVMGSKSGELTYVTAAAKVGLMVALFITVVQGVLMRGFRLDKLLLHFVLVFAFLIPHNNVNIISNDNDVTFAPRVVEKVPSMLALPLAVGTSIGKTLTEKMSAAFSPVWITEICPDNAQQYKHCSVSRVFTQLIANIIDSIHESKGRDFPSFIQFKRYCLPNGVKVPGGPGSEGKNVKTEWENFCNDLSRKDYQIPNIPDKNVKIGAAGQYIDENGNPVTTISCEIACNNFKNAFIATYKFFGCDTSDTACIQKKDDLFAKTLAVVSQTNMEAVRQVARNLMWVCVQDRTRGTAPIGSRLVVDSTWQKEAALSGCQEWADKVAAKLRDAAMKSETADARAAQWLVMMAVIIPLVAIAASVSSAWLYKIVPVYIFYVIFASTPQIVSVVADSILATKIESLQTAFFGNYVITGDDLITKQDVLTGSVSYLGTGCDATDDKTCARNFFRAVTEMAEAVDAAADFKISGHFALLAIFGAIGGFAMLGGSAVGGAAASAGGGGGSAEAGSGGAVSASASVGRATFNEAYVDAMAGSKFFGGSVGGSGEMSLAGVAASQFARTYGLKAFEASLSSAATGLESGNAGKGSSFQDATTHAQSGNETWSKQEVEQKSAQAAQTVSDIVAKYQRGGQGISNQMREEISAALQKQHGVSKEVADRLAATVEGGLRGSLGAGGRGAGGGASGGIGGSITGQSTSAVTGKDQKQANASQNESFGNSITTTNNSDIGAEKRNQGIDQASLARMFQETFQKITGFTETGARNQTAANNLNLNSGVSLNAGAANAALIREWLSSNMSAAEFRDHIMNKLAAGGMTGEQIAQFMNTVDQNAQQLSPYMAMMGGDAGVLIQATGMALQGMAYSGGKAGALTALQANAALLGQTLTAQALGQEYRNLVGAQAQTAAAAGRVLGEGQQAQRNAENHVTQGRGFFDGISNRVSGQMQNLAKEIPALLSQYAQAANSPLARGAIAQQFANYVNSAYGTKLNSLEGEQILDLAKRAAENSGLLGLVAGTAIGAVPAAAALSKVQSFLQDLIDEKAAAAGKGAGTTAAQTGAAKGAGAAAAGAAGEIAETGAAKVAKESIERGMVRGGAAALLRIGSAGARFLPVLGQAIVAADLISYGLTGKSAFENGMEFYINNFGSNDNNKISPAEANPFAYRDSDYGRQYGSHSASSQQQPMVGAMPQQPQDRQPMVGAMPQQPQKQEITEPNIAGGSNVSQVPPGTQSLPASNSDSGSSIWNSDNSGGGVTTNSDAGGLPSLGILGNNNNSNTRTVVVSSPATGSQTTSRAPAALRQGSNMTQTSSPDFDPGDYIGGA